MEKLTVGYRGRHDRPRFGSLNPRPPVRGAHRRPPCHQLVRVSHPATV